MNVIPNLLPTFFAPFQQMESKTNEQTKWIHLLFRGEKLPDNCRDDYVDEFTRQGIVATTVPILDFKFKNIEQLAKHLEETGTNGLIVTSPRVVEALVKAKRLLRTQTLGEKLDPGLVFVVGEKSGLECQEKLKLNFNTQSSKTGSGRALADYIRKFCNAQGIPSANLVYPKSSLSDLSVEEMLESESRIGLKSLVVYETSLLENVEQVMLNQITELSIPSNIQKLVINMIFFSPSGLDAYLRIGCEKFLVEQLGQHIFPDCKIEIKYSSIGKTTEAALIKNNLEVFCVSERPNALSLVNSVLQNLTK